jgi:hypothetical protein
MEKSNNLNNLKWSNAEFWISTSAKIVVNTDDFPAPGELLAPDRTAEVIVGRIGGDFARKLVFALIKTIWGNEVFLARKLTR